MTTSPVVPAPATRRRPPPAARRTGYLLAAAVNVVVLWLLLVEPGWRRLGFLTEDVTAVLGWVTVSLLAGVAVNLVLVAYDPPWVRRVGDALTAAVAAVALARVWVVFPFDLGVRSGWETALRVALGLAGVGTVIGVLANLADAFRLRRTA